MPYACRRIESYFSVIHIIPARESSHSLQSEVEETLKRIQSHKGVIGVIVVNQEGTIWMVITN